MPCSLKEINNRINDLLKESIKSDGIINLFSDINIGFSIFDEKFLEMLNKAMRAYINVMIINEEVIEEILKMARGYITLFRGG